MYSISRHYNCNKKKMVHRNWSAVLELLPIVTQINSVKFRNSTGFVLVFETGYDGVLPFSIIIGAFTVAFLLSGKSSGPLMFLPWMQKEIAT